MSDDAELLRRYVDEKADTAFAAFVQRHLDFVYGCALRRLAGDTHLASDVTQQVFWAAARDASRLTRHPVITAWLFTTTRNTAVRAIRAEQRRRDREQRAHAMNELNSDPSAGANWEQLRPVLDDALDALGETDRRAVLLRFFEGRSFAEIGGQLRMAENAARMRVNRALDKLSAALRRRGVDSTAAALAIALANSPVTAAPAGLAAAATSGALAAGVTHGAATGVLFMGLTKLQLGVAGALVMGGTVVVVSQQREAAALLREQAQLERVLAPPPATVAAAAPKPPLAAAPRMADAAAFDREVTALNWEDWELRNKIWAAERTLEKNAAAAAKPFVGSYAGPVLEETAVDVRPKPISRGPPHYPQYMRRLGIGGEAVIGFIIDPTGSVRDARVESTNHVEAGDAALAAIEHWRYVPGEKSGSAVAVHMRIPMTFTIQDDFTPPPDDPKRLPRAPWF